MYNCQAEVIEDVDALMNNEGLPTYSELVASLLAEEQE